MQFPLLSFALQNIIKNNMFLFVKITEIFCDGLMCIVCHCIVIDNKKINYSNSVLVTEIRSFLKIKINTKIK